MMPHYKSFDDFKAQHVFKDEHSNVEFHLFRETTIVVVTDVDNYTPVSIIEFDGEVLRLSDMALSVLTERIEEEYTELLILLDNPYITELLPRRKIRKKKARIKYLSGKLTELNNLDYDLSDFNDAEWIFCTTSLIKKLKEKGQKVLFSNYWCVFKEESSVKDKVLFDIYKDLY